MEQVWKDLTFPTTNLSSQKKLMFQDFLGAGSSSIINKETPPPPSPPPPIALDDFDYDNGGPPFNASIGGSRPSSDAGLFAFFPPDQRVFCDDRRNKRLVKNRASAARSRARKQAYTNQLELEFARRVAENGKLRKEYAELRRLAMAAQYSTKKTLQRTLTAPF